MSDYSKKTWIVDAWSGNKADTLDEAMTKAKKTAATNFNQVSVWELVATVQNELPTDLTVTQITA